MNELRYTEEQNGNRADSLKESQRRGVFVDEFGQTNPHVGTGSCRPATKGKLAEPMKREVAVDFIDSVSTQLSLKFLDLWQKLKKKHGRIIALQLIDDQLADIIKAEFEAEMRTQVQRIHEWFGEEKPEWHKDVIDQIGTSDGQYPPDKEEWICSRCGYRNAADNEVCMGAEMGDGRCGKPKDKSKKQDEEEIICNNCGAEIIRIGTCIKCLNCGNSIGCS